MNDITASEPQSAPAQNAGPSRTSLGMLILAVALSAGVVAFLAGTRMGPRAPVEGSPEAGFARDMSVHHGQAVEMAQIILERTEDGAVRVLALDIAFTQQGQIGQMQGWLDVWGLPATGVDPPMAWMGQAMDGPMPGMASPAEIARLRRLPAGEADRLFLTLMIRHHRGGIEMARGILERTRQPEVARLARAILDGQQAEITAMQALLGRPPRK